MIRITALGPQVDTDVTPKDVTSLNSGNQDGVSLCRDRTYVISGAAVDNGLVTIDASTQTAVIL